MSWPINPTNTNHSVLPPSSSSSNQSPAIPSNLSSNSNPIKFDALINRPLQSLNMSRSERFASYRPLFYSLSTLLTFLGVSSTFSSDSDRPLKYGGIALLFLGCGLGYSTYFTRTSEENWTLRARTLVNELSAQGSHKFIKQELKQFIMNSVGCNGTSQASISRIINLLRQICQEEAQKAQSRGGTALQGFHHLKALLKEEGLFTTIEIKQGKTVDLPIRRIDDILKEKVSDNQENKENRKITAASNLPLNDLIQQRKWRLQHKEEIYLEVIQDPMQQTAIKFFPFTSAWYIGGLYDTSLSFECALAEIGQRHGIIVISDSSHPKFLDHKNTLELVQSTKRTFPQDFLDFNAQEICFPTVVDSNLTFTTDVLKNTIYEAREKRFQPYKDLSKDDPIWAVVRGQPFMDRSYRTSLSLAEALNAQANMNLTYSEGGNMLIGFANHEAYAIIGLDSFSASKALIESDLKKKVSDLEVLIAFGIDYGIKIENLFFIEQPGDFHLDMNIAILGPKTVVVNDSEAAYDILRNNLGEDNLNALLKSLSLNEIDHPIQAILDATKERSSRKKIFENESSKQLKEKGFNVIRYPGRFEVYFPETPEPVPLMNFFNMVTANTPIGNVLIAMGCPDENCGYDFKELFLNMLRSGGLNPNQIEINFLNFKDSQESLTFNGGISCRVKTVASIPPEVD